MRRVWVVAALGALWGGVPDIASASPWNRDRGELLTISRYGYYEAEGASLGPAGEARDRRFTQSSSDLYVEWGVSDRVMAGGKLSYVWQGLDGALPNGARAGDALSGFAEASVFTQVALHRGDGVALSVMASASLPTETISRIGTDRAFARDGAGGIAVLLGASRGPAFASLRTGPEVSFGQDTDFLRTEASGGVHASDRVLLLAELFDTRSLGGGAPEGVDYDLTQLAPSLVLLVRERWRLQLGGTVDLSGRNVDLGTGAFVSLWVGE